EGHVVIAGRRRFRVGRSRRRSLGGWSGPRPWRQRRGTRVVASAATVNETETFEDYPKLGLLLVGVLVLPLVEFQTAFEEKRPALFHVLGDNFRLTPEGVDVHERHFLLLLPCFRSPVAIHGQAKTAHGRALGRVAQFR